MLPKYKDITELIKKGATVEALEKIMELREAALELQEENLDLRKQINALKKKLEDKANVVFEAPFYWEIIGEHKDGPFCQQCYDNSEKLIRLQTNGGDYWQCLTCKSGYCGPNYSDNFGSSDSFEDDDWV